MSAGDAPTIAPHRRQSHCPKHPTIDDHSRSHRKSYLSQKAESTSSPHIKRRLKRSASTKLIQDSKTTLFVVSAVFLLVLLIPIIPDKSRNDQNRRQLRSMDGRKITESSDYTGRKTGTGGRKMAIIPKYSNKHHFDECTGKSVTECQTLIDTYVSSHPADFNNRTSLWLDIRKIRELSDVSYYKVVIRTNVDGDKAYGIFDDGVIFYPWPWTVGGIDTEIGPWDCQTGGEYMTPFECCDKIQAAVPEPDDNGNYLACFVEEPVGGPNNPEIEGRVIVVTDGKGKVVRAPVAH